MPEGPEIYRSTKQLSGFAGKACKITTHRASWQLPSSASSFAAKSRGKEQMLCFDQQQFILQFGMTGFWSSQQLNERHLAITLQFESKAMYFYDARRFARLQQATWNANRSPCPMLQLRQFWQHLATRGPAINQPVFEALLRQDLFNGCGNYLRAELLDRLDFDPTKALAQLTLPELHKLAGCLHFLMWQSAIAGGAKLRDWSDGDAKTFTMQCYQHPGAIAVVDRGGRRFWSWPKWAPKFLANSYQLCT